MKILLNEVAVALHRNVSFVLLTHVQPDADALGSMLAMGMALEKMGKSVTYCTQGSDRLSFLPGYDKLKKYSTQNDTSVDALIYLDCANLERAEGHLTHQGNLTHQGHLSREAYLVGRLADQVPLPLVINIDHHISNDGYGDIPWIDPQSSSVGEMLWLLFAELGIVIDDAIAANLYASIINDTGQFAFHNTTQRTHVIAGALLCYEFGVSNLHKKLFYERSLIQTKLLARALGSLDLSHDGKVAVMQLTQEDFAAEGLGSDDCEGFINQAMSIPSVQVGMFVKEVEPHLCRASFRSREHIDVNRLASRFDGGGHVRASGCTLSMPLAQALPLLLEALDYAVQNNQ